MIYSRPEGEVLKNGFNFYPWKERKYSIGFIFWLNGFKFRIRYAPHVNKFYMGK